MKKDIEYWDWQDTAWVMFDVGLTVSFVLLVYMLCQDHRVQSYYMSDFGGESHPTGYCINASVNWWADETGVYCSSDIDETTEVLKKLNSTITR